jgi:hypothetical protein
MSERAPSKAERVVIENAAGLKLTVDATLTEQHTGTVELTRYPVESGISPTDHARVAPEKVQVDGIISNTPVGTNEQTAQGLEAIDRTKFALKQDVSGGAGSPGAGGYALRQLAVLLAFKNDRAALAVSGPLRKYKSMILTSLSYTRDAKVGDALKFSATFEEVRFVTNSTTQLAAVPTKVPTKSTKSPPPNQGKQNATPATPEQTRSVAKGIFNIGKALTKG